MIRRTNNLKWLPAWPPCWPACVAHQTPTTTPIDLAGNVPYKMELREVDFGATQMPLLHSYAAAEYDGKWILLSGRSNGVHDLERSGRRKLSARHAESRRVGD